MNRIKMIFITIFFIGLTFICTGCTNDDMQNINIIVTNYPNEYIVSKLYGDYSTIKSVYPDGVKTDEYKISNKSKKEYATTGLFVYNGLIEKERSLAVDLLDLNSNLKIIDTAYVLETDYSTEELWLEPSSLLMMAQNVRIGLEEYITATVLENEIDEKYEELKVTLSELDAEYRLEVENAENKKIVVANASLKFLEKFNFEVYCIDSDATDKTISEVNQMIDNNEINYIYIFKNDNINDRAQEILNAHENLKTLSLHKLDNITDEERDNDEDYISIMKKNLDELKKELYQ